METEEIQVRVIPEVSTPTTEVLSLADLMEEPIPSTEGWQMECDRSARGLHLLRSGSWADVQFAVGDSGEILQAHRLVVASASPVFAAMLYGPRAENTAPIGIKDVTPKIFKIMLQVMYADTTVEQVDVDDLAEIEYVSKKYLPRFLGKCLLRIQDTIKPEHAIRCYEYAKEAESEPILEECDKIFSAATLDILYSESIVHAKVDTLEHIFSLDDLLIPSEEDLLTVVERYADAHGIRKDENEELASDQKALVLPLLRQIRFLGLGYDDLVALHKPLRKFLTEAELLALLLHAKQEDLAPIPLDFTSKQSTRNMSSTVAIPGPICVGRVITIQGLVEEKIDSFFVYLQDGRDDGSDSRRTTMLLNIRVSFCDDTLTLFRFTSNHEPITEDRPQETSLGSRIKLNEQFCITITIESDRYVIRLNEEFLCSYDHRVPFETLSHFRLYAYFIGYKITRISFY